MSARDTQSDSPLLMDEAVLGYYHLQRDPFLPGNDFFTMPQWKDTIDMMTHFTRYSKLITIVTGVAGVGKSCFKKYFNSLVKANLYLGEISFDPQLYPAEIPSRIAKAFHLALTTPQANLAFDEAAKELLQQLM